MILFDDSAEFNEFNINTKLENQKLIKKNLKGENNMPNFENLKKLAGEEKVNHPDHYNREDAMECIDEMMLIFGKEATMHFCLLNAWKYRYRAAGKNGEEDLRKSDWYIKKYKELFKGITKELAEPVFEFAPCQK